MNTTMQAVGFQRYGSAEVLEQLQVARPALGADSVLIRVVAAGVNPADWRFRSGQFRFAIRLKLPFIPGSDVAGIVEAVGPAVTRFQPGDAVYAMLPTMSGGGYAEYAAATEEQVALMPRNLSFTDAASVPLAALTALQALRDKARLQAGAAACIYGASGGVGSFAVQIAKALGAQVTALCSERNMDFARQLGADEVIDYTRQDLSALTPRYDVLFDAVNALSFRQARRALRPNGVAVTVNPFADKLAPDWLARFRGGRRLRSLLVQPSGADLQTLADWIETGQLRPTIDRSYPLADVAEAHRYSETLRVRGKLVLVVDPGLASSSSSTIEEQQAANRRQGIQIKDRAAAILH
jgi:NADPH:quinone reductase-like Zn-dependent oxidoreductase